MNTASMGGKKVNGRKRHSVVDTMGNLLRVGVHPADLSDREAAQWWLEVVCAAVPTLQILFADQSYTGALVTWAKEHLQLALEIVKKAADQPGFVLLPRRWVVELVLSRRRRRRCGHCSGLCLGGMLGMRALLLSRSPKRRAAGTAATLSFSNIETLPW